MRARHARKIRSAIITARRFGWRKPAPMFHDRYSGLQYVDALYGRAWERTMRAAGLYPPRPPRGPGGVSSSPDSRPTDFEGVPGE